MGKRDKEDESSLADRLKQALGDEEDTHIVSALNIATEGAIKTSSGKQEVEESADDEREERREP